MDIYKLRWSQDTEINPQNAKHVLKDFELGGWSKNAFNH